MPAARSLTKIFLPSKNSSREPRLEKAPFMAKKNRTPARF